MHMEGFMQTWITNGVLLFECFAFMSNGVHTREGFMDDKQGLTPCVFCINV